MHAVPLAEVEADGERRPAVADGAGLQRRDGRRFSIWPAVRSRRAFRLHPAGKEEFFRSTLAMYGYLAGGSPKVLRHLRARRIDIRRRGQRTDGCRRTEGAEFPLHISAFAGGLQVM